MKTLSKIAAIAISAAMAVCAFGCGSSDTSAQSGSPGFEPQGIEVVDLGYSITNEGEFRYAFVAVNPNEGHVAENVVFTVEAYDSNGSMIAGGGETISALYPGTETAGAGETELFSRDTATPKVANFSIVAMMDSVTWTTTTITDSDIEDSIEVIKPRMSGNDDGGVDIKASVKLAEGDALKFDASKPVELRAVALLFDENDEVLCGTSPVTFSLDANSDSYSFEQTVSDAPAYSKCSLYVTPTA